MSLTDAPLFNFPVSSICIVSGVSIATSPVLTVSKSTSGSKCIPAAPSAPKMLLWYPQDTIISPFSIPSFNKLWYPIPCPCKNLSSCLWAKLISFFWISADMKFPAGAS